MLTKSRVIQLVIMLCTLIGLFVWRTIDLPVNEDTEQIESNNVIIVEDKLCDFLTPCEFTTPWGIFSLSHEQGAITPEKWFHLTLKSDVENWKVVRAKTVGKNMFMGKIPMMFSPVIKNADVYQSSAKSMVGACTEAEMVWRFDIEVEIEGKLVNLYYDFLISH